MDYSRIFQDIISSNHYLVLGTASEDGNPWVAPIAYVWDGRSTLFFISHTASKHSLLIEKNPKIGFSIFHTEQIAGNAF